MSKLNFNRSYSRVTTKLIALASRAIRAIPSSIFLVFLAAYVLLYTFFFMLKASFLMIVSIIMKTMSAWFIKGGSLQHEERSLIGTEQF
ncbi:MAG TPA: hypothetical protein VIN11_01020 [Roseivirga sp.]